MLSKRHKLSKKDFDILDGLKKKKVSQSLFSLVYNKNNEKPSKISVVVSKKISKKATDRNKLKRLIFDQFKDFTLKNKGFSVVVYPKKEALTNQNTLKKELKETILRDIK
ncbi:ribonuclease P protein component [Candidatus Nomurabacteria bacterium]|nr:ribonuclease P protein component [Candidatus Nomurabacteria bacterium]MCB9820449.1 ribonuclease P protein component [Candidatus Nomurabacteria bacterium]